MFGGIDVPDGESDTAVMMQQLKQATSREALVETLTRVEGPWSLIFWRASSILVVDA